MSPLLPLALCLLGATGDSPLAAAEKAYQELEFDRAEKLYLQALELPGTRDERRRAWRGLGTSQAIQGETGQARASFEKLLLIDPSATVDASLGPKIQRPFDSARAALAGKRNTFEVVRERSGTVTVRVSEDVPLASEIELRAREKDGDSFQSAHGTVDKPPGLTFGQGSDVEAYAEGRDARGGVVYQSGSAKSPRFFPAPTPGAVASAAEEARREANGLDSDDGGQSSNWPIYAGIGAAAVAGVVAAVVLSQPPPLQLPEADRISRLP